MHFMKHCTLLHFITPQASILMLDTHGCCCSTMPCLLKTSVVATAMPQQALRPEHQLTTAPRFCNSQPP
jgi:hypothetical protein